MFAVFTIDIFCGEHEFTYEHWCEGKDENEIKEIIISYLKSFYEDAELTDGSELNGDYETIDMRYNLGSYKLFEEKAQMDRNLLSRLKV